MMDWRDLKNYPAVDSPGEVWAWEFLRRSPKYRADYTPWFEIWRSGNNAGDLAAKMLERWGINRVGDPNDPEDNPFVSAYPLNLDTFGNGDFLARDEKLKTEMDFRFDVRFSPKAQFAVIEKAMTERRELLQATLRRDRGGDAFVRYLRILDGTEQGATIAELAQKLYSSGGEPELVVSSDRSRAMKLRDDAYLELLKPQQ